MSKTSAAVVPPPAPGSLRNELFALLFSGQPTENRSDGETLFLQDDPSDRVFGIVSGTIEISLLSPEGRKVVANMVPARSLVGEIGAFDGGPRTATASCAGPCVIQSLSRVQFLDKVTKTPALSAAMFELLCSRIRWINGEFGDQVMLKVDARVAKRLVLIAALHADREGWMEISQSELADYLGATRESVNKSLRRWKDAGLIDLRRNGIRILDPDRLKAIFTQAPAQSRR